MFNVLTALAMGIVIFAITIGVGVVVLDKFGQSVAECASGYAYNNTPTTPICSNTTGAGAPQAVSTATTTTSGLITEMGTGGLAGWTAAIVALAVGLLFIGALMGKRQK